MAEHIDIEEFKSRLQAIISKKLERQPCTPNTVQHATDEALDELRDEFDIESFMQDSVIVSSKHTGVSMSSRLKDA